MEGDALMTSDQSRVCSLLKLDRGFIGSEYSEWEGAESKSHPPRPTSSEARMLKKGTGQLMTKQEQVRETARRECAEGAALNLSPFRPSCPFKGLRGKLEPKGI